MDELDEERAELETQLAEARILLNGWARLWWAMYGPDPLWAQSVRFLGDYYTGYDRDRAAFAATTAGDNDG
jgi:hypothetical protein